MAGARFVAATALASMALALFATAPVTRPVAAAEPDLTLNLIQHGPLPALDGEIYASYAVMLQNVGTSDTTGPIVVTLSLPAEMTFIYVDSFPNSWSCVDGVDLVCTGTGVLEAPPATDGDHFVILVRLESSIAGSVLVSAVAETAGELITNNNSDSVMTSTAVDRPPACAFEIELQTITGAGGVSNVGATTSTTSHTTQTVDDDGVTIEQYETRVTATLNGAIIFDETFNGHPDSDAVEDLLEEAEEALEAANASASDPATLASTRTLVDSDDTPTIVVDHTETDVSTQVTFGPATLLVGDEQSITCFVAAGLLNTNSNTHTETFEVLSTVTTETYLNFTHLEISGEADGDGPIFPEVTPRPNLGSVLIGPRRALDPPVTVAPASTTIRPPSTGDAGLR